MPEGQRDDADLAELGAIELIESALEQVERYDKRYAVLQDAAHELRVALRLLRGRK